MRGNNDNRAGVKLNGIEGKHLNVFSAPLLVVFLRRDWNSGYSVVQEPAISYKPIGFEILISRGIRMIRERPGTNLQLFPWHPPRL